MSPTKVLFATSEAFPFTPSGSLSDTSSGLVSALNRLYDVTLVLPLYSIIDIDSYGITKTELRFGVPVSDHDEPVEIWKGTLPRSNVTVYFVASHYFERDALYGTPSGDYPDNSERFVFFSRAVLELAERVVQPDIIHCNDWQTAMVPVYLKEAYHPFSRLTNVKTLLTIHNLGYQGKFWVYDLHILNLGWGIFTPDKIEFYNHINYLKGGLVYADAVTTVSRTYAEEIKTSEFGFGLEGVLKKFSSKLSGITNGMDTAWWNPAVDDMIPATYSEQDVSGKLLCRDLLCKEFGVENRPDIPIFGMVSRFNAQKGIDLLIRTIGDAAGIGDAQFLILGSGEKYFEDMLKLLADRSQGRIKLKIAFDERLSHIVHAGSDFLLMPSRYEPCGMDQLYAMKYGTVPIVRAVGGLHETVIDSSENKLLATGLKFRDYTPETLKARINDAVQLFKTAPEEMRAMMLNGMRRDFSFARTAESYSELYESMR